MKVILNEVEHENGLPIHDIEIFNDLVTETGYYIQDLSDCPEDAHIGRDLISGHDLINLIELAYDAGKRGEELNIIYQELEEK
jgi:hypothetical protein